MCEGMQTALRAPISSLLILGPQEQLTPVHTWARSLSVWLGGGVKGEGSRGRSKVRGKGSKVRGQGDTYVWLKRKGRGQGGVAKGNREYSSV